MNDPAVIDKELLAFVKNQSEFGDDIDEQSDLIESGILDSLLVADLLVHIESVYRVSFSVSDISPQNLRSVARLTQLITAKQAKCRGAA